MRAGFERAVRDDESHRSFDAVPMPDGLRFASGEGPIHEALLVDRAAFRDDPIPPLTELYAAAGLVERNGLIADDGFDWDALHVVADPQPARHLLRARSGAGRRCWPSSSPPIDTVDRRRR